LGEEEEEEETEEEEKEEEEEAEEEEKEEAEEAEEDTGRQATQTLAFSAAWCRCKASFSSCVRPEPPGSMCSWSSDCSDTIHDDAMRTKNRKERMSTGTQPMAPALPMRSS
jgi:hypothetical protein